MSKFSRRDFLKTAALGTAAVGLGGLLRKDSAWAQEPPLVRVVQIISPGVMSESGPDPARVRQMVERGLQEITATGSPAAAWGRFVQPSDLVGLKINPLGAPLLTTHKELVLALANSLQQAGLPADHIIVWDRSATDLQKAGWTPADEPGALRVLGSDQVGYDEQVYCDCDPADAQGHRRSHFSQILTRRITKLINVPVLKHHAMCGISFALKNLAFGTCNHVSRGHANHCADFIPAIYAHPAVQRKLTLIIGDALRPQYAGGPGGKTAYQWNCDSLVFALGQLSADAVGLAQIDQKRQAQGLPPLAETNDKPLYLQTAAQAGLGIADLDKITWQKIVI